MKKTITSCISLILFGAAISSYADTSNQQSVQFSVQNSNPDTFNVTILPYFREYDNQFTNGSYQDVYTARKTGFSSPCGHDAHVEIRDENKICPLAIDFKIASCKKEPAQISINITNFLVADLTSSTNSVSDITYYMPLPDGGCRNGNPKFIA